MGVEKGKEEKCIHPLAIALHHPGFSWL